MRIASVGHAVFAATMIGLGIIVLVTGRFTAIWSPAPVGVLAHVGLAYLCGFVTLSCGIGLFRRRSAGLAAGVLLVYLLIWLGVFRLPGVFQAPLVEGSYEDPAETLVMIAGSWVLFAWFADAWRGFGFATGAQGIGVARAIYGMALIPLGLAHFFYLRLTAPLVPGWLPWHVGWAYLTGGAYVAAGIAILVRVAARLAATLSAVQMGVFTLLVWVPMVAGGAKDAFTWSETLDSWALTAAAWVVVDSFRGGLL